MAWGLEELLLGNWFDFILGLGSRILVEREIFVGASSLVQVTEKESWL